MRGEADDDAGRCPRAGRAATARRGQARTRRPMPIDAADRRHQPDLPQHHPAHRAAVRAERHAHADLARALRDGVREHAVQSDAASSVASDGERRGQRRDHAIDEDVFVHLLRQQLESLDGQIRIELLHHVGNRAQDLLRRQRRAHVEIVRPRCVRPAGTAARTPAGSGPSPASTSQSFARPTIVRSSESLPIDMCLPTAFAPRLNFFANASLTIDDLHRAVEIAGREVAARQQRDAEHVEVVRADGVVARAGVGVRILLEAFDRNAFAPVVAGEELNADDVTPADAGNRRELFLDAAIERQRTRRVVAAPPGRDRRTSPRCRF